MQKFLDRILEDKRREIETARKQKPIHELQAQIKKTPWTQRGFFQALAHPGAKGINIIAEVKRASPSKGDICADLDAAACARAYEQGGATAISVLTDAPYFKGSLADLRQVRSAVSLPVLRKEFIISRYQIYETRAAGADALLLITRILTTDQLKELLALTIELDMNALVEIHSPDDYEAANAAGARLIGINNRNLATFDTDLEVAIHLTTLLKPGQVPVAASGISDRSDIETNLQRGIFNFLIGESLVRAQDRVRFLRELMPNPHGN